MNNHTLVNLISDICTGSYCQAQLIQFINLTKKISLGYLKYQEVIGKRISTERSESHAELQDVALDCIAELFSGDGAGKFPQLQKYYDPFLSQASMNDAEILALTRRLVVRKTKQELSRIFRERDPEGAKIVRNIKVAVRSSEKLEMFRDLGKEFVFYKNGIDLNNEGPASLEVISQYLRREASPIPEDLLHTRFVDIYHPNDSISSAIKKLLKTIHELDEYQNFLAMDVIVKMIRDIKYTVFREKLTAEDKVPTPLDQMETQEIESYIQIVMEQIDKKIQKLYVKSNKLSREKARIYSLALRDVLLDLLQKKDSSSYYRNLKYYIPELTQSEYRKNERTIFEYLAKVAKKNFRLHLKALL